MVTSSAKPQRSYHFGWRALVVSVLSVVGLVALTGFMVAHWAQRQILTTDNYVAMVGSLPQDPEVASALSSYSVNKLFVSLDLSNKIEQALPDKLGFLAPTLTDQLQSRLTKRTQQLVQSDAFATVWTTANRRAMDRLLATARGEAHPKQRASFDLNLAPLRANVVAFIGKDSPVDTAVASKDSSPNIGVGLKTSAAKLHSYIRTVDFLNGTLGLLAVVCLVGAVVITRYRRRLLIVLSSSLMVIALLQLIGIKVLRPSILNQVEQAAYRPAVSVVYDTLLATFRHTATVGLVVGLVVLFLSLLLRRRYFARVKPVGSWLKSPQNSTLMRHAHEFRSHVRQYRWPIAGVIALIGLVLMAFILELDWLGVLRTIMFILFAIEIVNLVAARTEDMPMKQ